MQQNKTDKRDHCVIIPTYNPGRYLSNLKKISECATLVIIDSESQDGSIEEIRSWGVHLIEIKKSNFNHGSTRNLGAEACKHMEDIKYYIFMTQDAEIHDENIFDHLLHPLRTGEAVAGFARQLPRLDASLLESFSRYYNYPSSSQTKNKNSINQLGIKTFFFSNVASVIRSDIFWEMGGFPSDVIMNEDMVMASKIIESDYNIKYVADAVVIHSHEYKPIQQFKRNFDVGAFFADVGGILTTASIKSEGLKFVVSQIRYVLSHHRPDLVGSVIIEAAAKFAGFQLGKRHRMVPLGLKKHMSMHNYHWTQEKE